MTARRALWLAFAVLAADQLSKRWILGRLPADTHLSVPITPFFNLTLVWNHGISFGLFAQRGDAAALPLILLAVLIVAVLMQWLSRVETRLAAVAIGLVSGGAIGNVIDRFRFGAVIDFLDFHLGAYHWPSFNVADSAICIGVALLVFESILARPKGSP